jgi:CHAT domain-containing protein
LPDVYGLRAPVQLVVLSACQTALGKDVRGEGLMGLTRGFMYAGASGVVSSLWKVDDEATAELMRQFYFHMLEEGLPPAAALRTAQNEIRQRPEWRSPYFWAAFTLQGDYRHAIKGRPIGGYKWVPMTIGISLLALIALLSWWYLRGRASRVA